MKTKIKTPAGFMCLADENMVSVAKASFKNVVLYKEIEIRNVVARKEQTHYKMSTPYGYAYIKSYDNLCRVKLMQHVNDEQKTLEIITVN